MGILPEIFAVPYAPAGLTADTGKQQASAAEFKRFTKLARKSRRKSSRDKKKTGKQSGGNQKS